MTGNLKSNTFNKMEFFSKKELSPEEADLEGSEGTAEVGWRSRPSTAQPPASLDQRLSFLESKTTGLPPSPRPVLWPSNCFPGATDHLW